MEDFFPEKVKMYLTFMEKISGNIFNVHSKTP